jgi:hypothetical protein
MRNQYLVLIIIIFSFSCKTEDVEPIITPPVNTVLGCTDAKDVKPEYSENLNSVISISKSTSISFSKYFLENNFKLITSISNNKDASDQSSVFANLILQLKL